MLEYTEDTTMEDLIRQGLQPGDTYLHYEMGEQTFDPRDHYVGGDIPDHLIVSPGGNYGDPQ